MSPPVSNSNLCHTICFVIINSSAVLVGHFMGTWRPKGVLRASNYKGSAISTWSQGRGTDRRSPPQLSASGSSPTRALSCPLALQ